MFRSALFSLLTLPFFPPLSGSFNKYFKTFLLPLCSKRDPLLTMLQILTLFFFFFFLVLRSFSQKTCPNCGSIEVPYPLRTASNCGDSDYTLRCDSISKKLYLDSLNGSSYLILRITPSSQTMVVQPSPWLPATCVTRDMAISEGLWLNQSLPFNITSSNTIFLFNCSPRLLVSPLNCTPSSLCHVYLQSSGRVDSSRAAQCSTGVVPCCTFRAGGMPSAYKIRLHSSGCRAFRSILHLDVDKPANQWEEGLEIQWKPPSEPVCTSQLDCFGASRCSVSDEHGLHRCLCNENYRWDHLLGICVRNNKSKKSKLGLKISILMISFVSLSLAMSIITFKKCRRISDRAKLAKARENLLTLTNGAKPAKLFSFKEVKKATNGFSKNRVLGSGGFGEVYKGELQDGTVVAVKAAKIGSIKSTKQILNEVGILSQVNHKNLVRLLGCCIESDQPLMIYEFVSNGTLHDHLHGKFSTFLDWKTRLKIALQIAEALAYLHSAAYPPIYHRDVKSTNILLDNDFNAKVSDFGLSRLVSPGSSHVSTCAQGTLGYLDPEYYRTYKLTDKSDVYSYGVVLLELLTSQKSIDFSRDEEDINLAIYVSQRVSKNDRIMEVLDQSLLGNDQSGELPSSVKLLLELALGCLREKREERPCMKDVVQELESLIHVSNHQAKPTEISQESMHLK